jgi:hypothetical protein
MTKFDEHTSLVEVDAVEQEEYNEKPELYFRAIRFKGGEEIVCAVYADDIDWTTKKFVLINDPYIVNPDGLLRPWSVVTDQYQIPMATDTMLAMYMVSESVEGRYEELVKQAYIASLRDDLKNPDLPEDERESIEQELYACTDIDDEPVFEQPEMFGYLPVSKQLH